MFGFRKAESAARRADKLAKLAEPATKAEDTTASAGS